MIILTVGVGIIAGGILDYFQTKRIRAVFYAELLERLNRQSQEDRLHFDLYISTHNKASKLIISQKQFIDYVKSKDFSTSSPQTRHFHEIPSWLPQASVLRSLIQIRYALLLDAKGRVREVYQNWPDAPPKSLLKPTNLLIKLSHNENYMTEIDGMPFLITAETVIDSKGDILATLMLASPLDSEFLLSSQGPKYQENIIALVEREKKQVLASNKPELMPNGTALNDLEGRYIITGKSFFDEGASDLLLQFTSFISVSETEALIKAVVSSNRQQRILIVFILILFFSFIGTYITRQIRRLAQYVLNFSEQTLGIKSEDIQRGDELYILKEQFQRLTKAIVQSHNELSISEKQYRLLFQKSPVGIFHYTTNLQLTDCNERFVEILQSTREKLIGLDMKVLKDQSVLPAIQKALSGKDGLYEGFYRATTGLAEIWVSMKTAPIFDSEGKITGGICIVEDITERKKMDEELKSKIEELEKFYGMAVGRELKMKELKEELARLKTELEKYKKEGKIAGEANQ